MRIPALAHAPRSSNVAMVLSDREFAVTLVLASASVGESNVDLDREVRTCAVRDTSKGTVQPAPLQMMLDVFLQETEEN